MMMVALRVDASAEIGLGHLRRCLSLALALRARGAHCHFVLRDLGLDLVAMVEAEGFDCTLLPRPALTDPPTVDPRVPQALWAGVKAETDVQQTVAALRHGPPRALVVDHYAFDARWHRAVGQALGCAIVAIDDTADRDIDAALLIDHNHAADHRAKYGAHLAASTELLGGPRYALLGPAYAGAPRCKPAAEVRSIGIFMGGTDAEQFSALALRACTQAGFVGPVAVATTAANPHLAALRQAVAQRPATRLLVDQPDLAGFFARHDLQIGAGGGATWERCCIGAPTLALIAADNQRSVLQPLAGLGVLDTVDAVPPTASALGVSLRRLLDQADRRAQLAQAARRLVDGQGATRAAERILR